jgi:hypothetical protein
MKNHRVEYFDSLHLSPDAAEAIFDVGHCSFKD